MTLTNFVAILTSISQEGVGLFTLFRKYECVDFLQIIHLGEKGAKSFSKGTLVLLSAIHANGF